MLQDNSGQTKHVELPCHGWSVLIRKANGKNMLGCFWHVYPQIKIEIPQIYPSPLPVISKGYNPSYPFIRPFIWYLYIFIWLITPNPTWRLWKFQPPQNPRVFVHCQRYWALQVAKGTLIDRRIDAGETARKTMPEPWWMWKPWREKKQLKLDSCLFISRDSPTPNKFQVQQMVFEPSSFTNYVHVELGIIAKRFGVTQTDLKNQHLAVFLEEKYKLAVSKSIPGILQ